MPGTTSECGGSSWLTQEALKVGFVSAPNFRYFASGGHAQRPENTGVFVSRHCADPLRRTCADSAFLSGAGTAPPTAASRTSAATPRRLSSRRPYARVAVRSDRWTAADQQNRSEERRVGKECRS